MILLRNTPFKAFKKLQVIIEQIHEIGIVASNAGPGDVYYDAHWFDPDYEFGGGLLEFYVRPPERRSWQASHFDVEFNMDALHRSMGIPPEMITGGQRGGGKTAHNGMAELGRKMREQWDNHFFDMLRGHPLPTEPKIVVPSEKYQLAKAMYDHGSLEWMEDDIEIEQKKKADEYQFKAKMRVSDHELDALAYSLLRRRPDNEGD